MSTRKVRQDATASTRGTIYHLCVAVQKCYELQDGQKLLIEELGDITIFGNQQVEVKQYADNLTDGHHNFWNTLKNWMDEQFDHTPYAHLILHTTQQFGSKATIAAWNDIGADEKLDLLIAINKSFETEFDVKRAADPKLEAGAVLKHQRFVLEPQRRAKLRSLLGRVWIEANALELPELYEELKQKWIRGNILKGKKNDYLNSLIGFVCRSDKKAGEHWEITYTEFEAKLGELYATFNYETRRFPRKQFTARSMDTNDADRNDLFVKKIQDIDYPEVILSAIHDYEATMITIDHEFRNYAVDPDTVEDYSIEVGNRFSGDYRSACRKCLDELADSKDLYDRTTCSPATSLPGFGDTPDGFRNGLLHQRMNNPDADLMWKIRKK